MIHLDPIARPYDRTERDQIIENLTAAALLVRIVEHHTHDEQQRRLLHDAVDEIRSAVGDLRRLLPTHVADEDDLIVLD